MNLKTVKMPDRKNIVCPHCQGILSVSVQCFSIPCQFCNRHVNVKELLAPINQNKKTEIEKRKVSCIKCNKEISTDKNAQAIVCKYCYYRNDLSDHKVKTVIGTILLTHGSLYLVKKGIIETSTIQVGSAIISGKVTGNITAFGTVEILKKGAIKGDITCRRLIVNKGGTFEGHVQILNSDGSYVS